LHPPFIEGILVPTTVTGGGTAIIKYGYAAGEGFGSAMSVIPLVIEGENPTIVETPTAFNLEGSAILMRELDRDQLSSNADANLSYDLRIGREYRDHRDLGKRELPEGGEIKMSPGSAVIIETEEFLQLPRSMFGQILPKVSLLQAGISNTSSKVDPGYSGHLLVTVFNLGKKTVTLQRRQRFCSLCLFQVGTGAQLYNKPSKRIEGAAGRAFGQRIGDWFERNLPRLTAVLIFTTILLIILNIVQLLRK
jgi:dCTP deaminase